MSWRCWSIGRLCGRIASSPRKSHYSSAVGLLTRGTTLPTLRNPLKSHPNSTPAHAISCEKRWANNRGPWSPRSPARTRPTPTMMRSATRASTHTPSGDAAKGLRHSLLSCWRCTALLEVAGNLALRPAGVVQPHDQLIDLERAHPASIVIVAAVDAAIRVEHTPRHAHNYRTARASSSYLKMIVTQSMLVASMAKCSGVLCLSCRFGGDDFVPDGEAGGHLGSPLGCTHQMTTGPKMLPDVAERK